MTTVCIVGDLSVCHVLSIIHFIPGAIIRETAGMPLNQHGKSSIVP